ncbi:MAG: peptidase [Salinivirgaceae bacterium]|nr:peptidase [Salinivirgaceae bacterium]
MIRNIYHLFLFLFILSGCQAGSQTLIEQLRSLPNVVSVEAVAYDANFAEQYEVYFEQPLDHNNPVLGHFNQRVIVSHQGKQRPVVAVLEGYQIWNGQQDELTQLLNANQVNIEHRFFKSSRPDSVPWEKLTIWQTATDQHKIIEALQTIYPQNWISTGISKGGQATMYHRTFYPGDVKASVAYVAPLNYQREDPRIYRFLNSVGTAQDRERVYDFQCLCFEHFNELESMLKQKAKDYSWTFEMGTKMALQYTILEYSFAFWQWGAFRPDEIPGKESTTDDIFYHLNRVSGFTFFEANELEANRAFFWAALTEMGMYGYQTEPFRKYLGDTTDYTFDFSAPEGIHPVFNPQAMQQVKSYLDGDAKNMLFIVGGLDTWSATTYEPTGNNNLVRMTLPNGHHGTRIKDFNPLERKYIYSLLENWMEVSITDPFAE